MKEGGLVVDVVDYFAMPFQTSQRTLILTVGLPRSGKSTWVREQGHPMVNPDAIRLALYGKAFCMEAEPMVWAIAHYMVKALFLAGHSTVILDATMTTEKRRVEWLSDDWKTVLHMVPTPAHICVDRAVETNRPQLVGVIERMADTYEYPPNDKNVWEYV